VLALAALLAARKSFDSMHLFVLTENVTTGERSLHLVAADWMPAPEGLVRNVSHKVEEEWAFVLV
jgi:hypothetical protein